MIETGTGLALLGSAVGGAKVVEKILGPTADYVGKGLKDWTEKRVNNVSNIFKNAAKKLGTNLEVEGTVPPKVLKGILEEGAWCDDDLQIDYFGGVLASSRSGLARDDRGAYFSGIISRMSSFQLRTHYIFYHYLNQHFKGDKINIWDVSERGSLKICVPMLVYYMGMEFFDDDSLDKWNLMGHSVWGLHKEDLIGPFIYGNKEILKEHYPNLQIETSGIVFEPASLGVELFMWAYGYGRTHVNSFFNTDYYFEKDPNVILGDSIALSKI